MKELKRMWVKYLELEKESDRLAELSEADFTNEELEQKADAAYQVAFDVLQLVADKVVCLAGLDKEMANKIVRDKEHMEQLIARIA